MALSPYDEIEKIWFHGREKLMTFKPSPELLDAIDALEDALQQGHTLSRMGDNVVEVWEIYGDTMYEQERENFAGHLIDPILDVINAGYY